MKKFLSIGLIVLSAIGFTGCGYSKVPVGSIGVKVNLYGSNKGETKIVSTGGYWLGIGTEIYKYPTTQTQYAFTADSIEGSEVNEEFRFNVKGGITVAMDIGVIAYADPTMADTLYTNYRTDMETIMKKFVRQEIRNELISNAGNVTIDELTEGKLSEVMKTVEKNTKDKFAKLGLTIVSISPMNDVRYPKEIKDAIVSKIKATQVAMQKENELRTAEANAKIVEANAKAEAMANEAKKVSLNPALLEYERIQNERLMIEAWKQGGSKVPTTVTIIGDDKANLMLGIPK